MRLITFGNLAYNLKDFMCIELVGNKIIIMIATDEYETECEPSKSKETFESIKKRILDDNYREIKLTGFH